MKSGEDRTLVELRDPERLSQAIVLWLDGAADSLADLPPRSAVAIRVESLRAGRTRGELVGEASRDAVVEAFKRATAGKSS
jgi:hypothetical protein